jgi:hypothetical protein
MRLRLIAACAANLAGAGDDSSADKREHYDQGLQRGGGRVPGGQPAGRLRAVALPVCPGQVTLPDVTGAVPKGALSGAAGGGMTGRAPSGGGSVPGLRRGHERPASWHDSHQPFGAQAVDRLGDGGPG